MRLHIDWTACDGRGLCAGLLPELLLSDVGDIRWRALRAPFRNVKVFLPEISADSHYVRF